MEMELQSRIDFHTLAKPGNLANSAVLRMLEEEERSGRQQADREDVYGVWIERFFELSSHSEETVDVQKLRKWSVRPPKRLPWHPQVSPKEATCYNQFKPIASPGLKRVAWPPPPEETYDNDQSAEIQEPVYSQGLPQYQQQPQQYNQPQYNQQQPQQNQFRSPPSPIRSVAPPSPRQEQQQPFSAQQQPFSPQQAPVSPPVFQPVRFEPPRATVTLRKSPPLSQEPQPVYAAQPVAATIKGGERMRGDQKWPPESVKQQTAAENEARVALAKGPACRPRKVKKDYGSFFAQHALNSTYPGYRAPPGTQHYCEGTSDL